MYFNILENVIWYFQEAAAGRIQSSNITHHKLLNFVLESMLIRNAGQYWEMTKIAKS